MPVKKDEGGLPEKQITRLRKILAEAQEILRKPPPPSDIPHPVAPTAKRKR